MATNKRKFHIGQRISLTERPDAIRLVADNTLEFEFHGRTPHFVPAGNEIFVRPADAQTLTPLAKPA